MFLKSLTISSHVEVIREIVFHMSMVFENSPFSVIENSPLGVIPWPPAWTGGRL
jgi:hypothetical protein